MRRHRAPADHPHRAIAAAAALVTALPLTVTGLTLAAPAAQAAAPERPWVTVVNNGQYPPGSAIHFNSYNQPSVSSDGVVVFRGRTQGSDGGGAGDITPLAAAAAGSGSTGGSVRGVYSRDMGTAGSVVGTVAQTGDSVPQPNNSDGHFNEFPSFPRISADGSAIVTRGQSTPVWTYTLDGTDTKVGTSGVYATVGGTLTTGVSLLGAVPGYEDNSVPNAPAGTRFDQFPASPSIDGTTVVFKGNYTGTAAFELTGDYYRDLSQPDSSVQLLADSSTVIPNQPAGGTVTFGSTAPPSASGGRAVFTGWDSEETPTLGGVYLAGLTPSPALQTIAGIGDQVPGEAAGQTFTNFGEGLSFDGRFVAFWGTWGTQTRTVQLNCLADGNADLVAYCQQQYPDGYTAQIPVHQGIFVYDTVTGQLDPVATTGAQFSDFTYWVYSGAPPGVGGSTDATREPPRWRSSPFVAVSGLAGGAFQTAFKATTTTDSTVGIYLAQGPAVQPPVVTMVDLTTPGQNIDPQAPAGSVVTAVGLERDGFRGRNLALSVSMLNAATTESWAGIYLTNVESDITAQTITFDSAPPASPTLGSSYTLAATATSGLPVTFSLDAATTNAACSLDGTTVHFDHPGTCVIDANQPGDTTFAAAGQVQHTIVVPTIATTVVLTPAVSPTVFGQLTQMSAVVTAATGTAAGTVQFAVSGAALGGPVTLVGGTATSPDLVGAGGYPLSPGSYLVTAAFTPSDPATYDTAQGSFSQPVGKGATHAALSVGSTSLTATVSPVAPAAGTVTGSVTFSVGGKQVGTAKLGGQIATLQYRVASGKTQQVAASYSGDANFAGSSSSMSRYDPTITAKLTSSAVATKYGWYRAAVTATFTCVTHGAALTTPCPAPVRFTRSAGGQSVTRTISAVDGGAATVTVRVNIDLTVPTVGVTGVRNGEVHYGWPPTVRCAGVDTLSGIAACTLTQQTSGTRTTYRATAADRAGNTRTITGSYTTLPTFVYGATYSNGAFNVRAGAVYVLVVCSATRPTYYDAAVYPRTPFIRDKVFTPAGRNTWTMLVRMPWWSWWAHDWNLGVRLGSTVYPVHVRVY